MNCTRKDKGEFSKIRWDTGLIGKQLLYSGEHEFLPDNFKLKDSIKDSIFVFGTVGYSRLCVGNMTAYGIDATGFTSK